MPKTKELQSSEHPEPAVSGRTVPPFPAELFAQVAVRAPVPPPDVMREYDAIVPGAAKEMFAGIVVEREARHALERKRLDASIAQDKRGMYGGLVVTAMAFALAAYAIHMGNPVAATAICGVNLVAIIGTFVTQKRAPDKP